MKSCTIYRTDKNYKIVTDSTTDTGLGVEDIPVYILPLTISDDILKDKIFNCLESSRIGIKMPETREGHLKWQKERLANLKEKSFASLYKKSKSCSVRIESELITIYPLECLNPRRGLTVVPDKIIRLKYCKEIELQITQEIIKILND